MLGRPADPDTVSNRNAHTNLHPVQRDADRHTIADSVAIADPDPSRRRPVPDRDCDGQPDCNADGNCDGKRNDQAHGNRDDGRHADHAGQPDARTDSDSYPDPDTNAHTDRCPDCYADGETNRNSYPSSHG